MSKIGNINAAVGLFSTAKIQRPDIIPSENVLRWSLQIWKVGQRSLTLLPNMVKSSKCADFHHTPTLGFAPLSLLQCLNSALNSS